MRSQVSKKHSAALFRAIGNVDTLISDGQTVKLDLNLEQRDSYGVYNAAQSRFTAPFAGWFEFHACAYLTALIANGKAALFLYVNGARAADLGTVQRGNATGPAAIRGSDQLYLAAGATVEVHVEAIGADTETTAARCSFAGHWIPGK